MIRLLLILPFLALLLVPYASAVDLEFPPPSGPAGRPGLQSLLADLVEEYRDPGKRADLRAKQRLLKMIDGRVAVTVRPAPGESTDGIDIDSLLAIGAKVRARSRHFLDVSIPVEALEAAAACPGVFFIQPPITPFPLTTSEGVSLTGADEYHAQGLNGSGIKVAVIDGGFIGYNLAMGHGDLPVSMELFDFSGTGFATDSEHGTAVAEAVYDMAPGADLYLMKISSSTDLENARDTCVARGIDVINHSMGWFGVPGDGTGIIGSIADSAYRAGILWVNSSGNHAWRHNGGVFTDTDADSWNEFSPGNEGIEVSASAGDLVRVYLTWEGWPSTNDDYDLYLMNSSHVIVASSTTRQATTAQEPCEYVAYTAPANGDYYISVAEHSSSGNRKYDIFALEHTLQNERTYGGSVLSPATAENVFAVGAINRSLYSTGPAEYFTSQGPTTDGRMKPELTGPDRCDSYTYGHWAGTSAASPHVAGAAAILLSAHPGWTVDSVWAGLTSSAIDMGPAGQDSTYGYGRLHFDDPGGDPVSSFTAEAGDESIQLAWTNPADAGFVSTTIRYSTSAPPSTPTGGSEAAIVPGSPGGAGSHEMTGLTNGTMYYFSAFAWNGTGYSEAVNASAEPADTTGPGVPVFSASKGDESVLLSWTLPHDPDTEGIHVEFSVTAFPESVGDGSTVPNGNGGMWTGGDSESGNWEHSGLNNGTVYYYSAFTYDEAMNYSARAEAWAVPEDTLPPDPVDSFTATPGDEEIRLTWTNPSTADFVETEIRFSSIAFPSDPTDGSNVPNGSGGLFAGSPGSTEEFLHTGLSNDTTYYYSAFAFDERVNQSIPSQASATPGDTTAPGPVTGLTATPNDKEVLLQWTNPLDPDFSNVKARYATNGYPVSPDGGSPVDNGNSGIFPGSPGADVSFTHTSLDNDTTYFYVLFTFDSSGNYSTAVTGVAATPGDTTAPGPVTGLTAIPDDKEVLLHWTNPSDPDFSNVKARYATNGYPVSPDGGSPVDNGNSGIFPGSPGADVSFTHTSLDNDTTYFYALFTFDSSGNYSTAVTGVAATPEDTTAPGPVTGLTVIPSDGEILLHWTNPSDPDFSDVKARYATNGYPASPDGGSPVDNGNSGIFPGSPGADVSFTHESLDNDTTYFYALFAVDSSGNHSAVVVGSASPEDMTPPAPPSFFHAEAGDSCVILGWTHATESDIEGTMIRFSTNSIPFDASAGEALPGGVDGFFPGAPGSSDSIVHAGLSNGQKYYYAAFCRDEVPLYSIGVSDSASPLDETAPELLIGLLHNPYLTSYFDLYLLASEPLDPLTVSVTIDDTPLPMSLNDPEENIWLGNGRITESGLLQIEASATDMAGNPASSGGSITAYKSSPGETMTLTSPDRSFAATITTDRAAHLLVIPAETDGEERRGVVRLGEGAYALTPSIPVEGTITIRIDSESWAEIPDEEIAIRGSSGETIQSYVNKDKRTVTASIGNTGIFRLARDRRGGSVVIQPGHLRLERNRPNPFNPSTTIRFETGTDRLVRLSVYSLSGRLVRILLDGTFPPGSHETVWDGTDEQGLPAMSGVYFCTIETGGASRTVKMILLR